jgi:hypothetical protein
MKVSSFQPMQGFEAASRAAAFKTAQPPEVGAAKAGAEVISPEELQFFSKMYPEQSKEISSYSTYSKDGVSPEYSVGSLIDKKS